MSIKKCSGPAVINCDSDKDNISVVNERTISGPIICKQMYDGESKKRLRYVDMKMTQAEENLYKLIVALKVNISQCKNWIGYKEVLKALAKMTSNAAFIKIAENMDSRARILTKLRSTKLGQKGKERTFHLKEKMIALSMLLKSPKAYRLFWKIFMLPSPRLLKSNQDDLTSGINKNIFSLLKRRASRLPRQGRLCMLLFNEMLVRPGFDYRYKKDILTDGRHSQKVDHCLVFMLKGIVRKYRQRIAYSFSSGCIKTDDLSRKIKQIISDLKKARFIPLAIVCDHRLRNVNAIKKLIDETKDVLKEEHNTFYVDGHEIVPLYDPPNLMKGVRNKLLTNHLRHCIKEYPGTAKWSHIKLLYRKNFMYKGMKLIYKLTKKHVIPEKIPKSKAVYALQVFSRTVGAFMGNMGLRGFLLPEEVLATAYLLLFFNKLFDSVNGCRKNDRYENPLLGPVTPISKHHMLWKDSIEALKSMEFVHPNTQKRTSSHTINSWISTLEGCKYLTKKLKAKYNINYIWMRRFNLDALEYFFKLE